MNIRTNLSKAYRVYRTEGIRSLLTAVAGYVRWIVEFGLMARLADVYLRLNGGTMTRDGLTFDVFASPIQRGTRYRMLRGTYERAERELISQYVGGDTDVVELGGGIGFVSCHINDRLVPDKRHVVVEANAMLIELLKRHRDLNDCSFDVVHAAYAPEEETITFDVGETFESGQVTSANEGISVEPTSLAALSEQYGLDDYVLVADVEGSEKHFTTSEVEELTQHCRLIIVESHFEGDRQQEFVRTLSDHGFECIDSRDDVLVFKRVT